MRLIYENFCYVIAILSILLNSGMTDGAECPWHFLPGKFLLTSWRKERQGKKGKWRIKTQRKIVKGKDNWKCKGKKYENEQRTFFFFFFSFFFFFCLSLFETNEIVWGQPKWKFLPGKRISCQENIGKSNFAPLRNIPLMPLLLKIEMYMVI